MDTMNGNHAIPLACGALSLILGVTGHAIPAGVFGLAAAILALKTGDRDGD